MSLGACQCHQAAAKDRAFPNVIELIVGVVVFLHMGKRQLVLSEIVITSIARRLPLLPKSWARRDNQGS